jgi:hypothetical protein
MLRIAHPIAQRHSPNNTPVKNLEEAFEKIEWLHALLVTTDVKIKRSSANELKWRFTKIQPDFLLLKKQNQITQSVQDLYDAIYKSIAVPRAILDPLQIQAKLSKHLAHATIRKEPLSPVPPQKMS